MFGFKTKKQKETEELIKSAKLVIDNNNQIKQLTLKLDESISKCENLFNEQQFDSIEEELESIALKLASNDLDIPYLKSKLDKFKIDIRQKIKDYNNPHVSLNGIYQQKDGRIKIDLDWNSSFIKHLKQNGYTGPDDNSIIQKYLLELSAQIAEDMKGSSDYE